MSKESDYDHLSCTVIDADTISYGCSIFRREINHTKPNEWTCPHCGKTVSESPYKEES